MQKFYRVKRFFHLYLKKIVKTILVLLLVFAVGYFINNILYGKIIWERAYDAQAKGEYRLAVNLYNNVLGYYKLFHVNSQNKSRYIDIQYKKAVCYLELNDIELADKAIKEGMYLMIDSYGLSSSEYAKYIRKNVINYYMLKKDYKQAKEFLVLAEYLSMKKKLKDNELAYINKLYGDLAKVEGKVSAADKYYKNAYRLAAKKNTLDSDEMFAIYDAVAQTYLSSLDYKQTIYIYSKLIENLNEKNCKDNSKFAYIKWKIGDIYLGMEKYESAISYYEDAYNIILDSRDTYELKKNINDLRRSMITTYQNLRYYVMAERLEVEIEKDSRG